MAEKLITSHSSRVKRAKEYVKNSPERISIFDREAVVEFYLLEDIVRLYEWRIEQESKKTVQTKGGEMAHKRNLAKFTAVVNLFKSAIEIAWSEITSGNYKAVWSSIPEGALMKAAGSLKYLPELRDLATRMLRRLSEEAIIATSESEALDEDLAAIESHEENVRKVKGLPSEAEIDALIKAVEIAIPDMDVKESKPKPVSRLD